MATTPLNVLILCTGNSARSIMAEAAFNVLGKGQFKAYSAGSKPAGKVNPFAIEIVQALGYHEPLRSKSWDEFVEKDAVQMDLVITVCDNAANETCPVWLGAPLSAHWGFEDPAAATGSDDEIRAEFARIFAQIRAKVEAISDLPIAELDTASLKTEITRIGKLPN